MSFWVQGSLCWRRVGSGKERVNYIFFIMVLSPDKSGLITAPRADSNMREKYDPYRKSEGCC